MGSFVEYGHPEKAARERRNGRGLSFAKFPTRSRTADEYHRVVPSFSFLRGSRCSLVFPLRPVSLYICFISFREKPWRRTRNGLLSW